MTDSNHKKLLGMGESRINCPTGKSSTLFPATTLAARYVQAKAMSEMTDDYYAQLIQAIGVNDIREWEEQIDKAERLRLRNRAVMDIIGSNSPKVSGHAASASGNNSTQEVTSEWIDVAILIQEKQCVLLYLFLKIFPDFKPESIFKIVSVS